MFLCRNNIKKNNKGYILEDSENQMLVEAVLFYEKETVSISKLSKLTAIDEDNVRSIIDNLNSHYQDHHGFELVEDTEGVSIKLKKVIYYRIKEHYDNKPKAGLSRSMMTVLSIIAYKQPVTKAEIEDIRGVASDNSIKTLLEKGIIEISGRKEAVGKPLLYSTTSLFLKMFNLRTIKDLPQINELKSDKFGEEDF